VLNLLRFRQVPSESAQGDWVRMNMKTATAVGTAEVVYSNRRAHQRVAARFDVRFQHVQDAARALRAYSLNFSAGGLCLRTRRAYDVGAHVRLQMTIEGEDFDLQGIIAWVRDEDEAIGVRFVNLSDEDRARIQGVVASFTREPR
jgi:uncharacterized protein (TIGR02266 family)